MQLERTIEILVEHAPKPLHKLITAPCLTIHNRPTLDILYISRLGTAYYYIFLGVHAPKLL